MLRTAYPKMKPILLNLIHAVTADAAADEQLALVSWLKVDG